MSRRAVIAAVLAVLGGVAAATLALQARVGPGPLEGTDGSLEGQALEIGQPYDFTSDALLLRNLGKKPITIDRVRVLNAAGPVELLEVRSRRINPEDPDQRLAGGGYLNETEPSVPLAQNRIIPAPKEFFENGMPADGLQIFLRLRVTKAGVARTDKIEVTYHAGDKKHRETFPFSMSLCAPRAEWMPQNCPEDTPPGDRALG